MVPIRPILAWPTTVYGKLRANDTEKNHAAKVLTLIYNGIFPPLATTIVLITSLVGFILAGLANLFLSPLVALHDIIQKISVKTGDPEIETGIDMTTSASPQPSFLSRIFHKITQLWNKFPEYYPKLENFNSPLPEVPFVHTQTEINDKNFPLIFPRSNISLPEQPQIIQAWPPLNKQKTNSLPLDFLQHEKTIPTTTTTFWGLQKQAGTPEGYRYLEEQGPKIIPVLFPSQDPSSLNKNAPVLSRETVLEIQTNPKIFSKYIANLSLLLKYWGLEISKDKQIVVSKDFSQRAAEIRNNKHRKKLFQQVVSSLGFCGLGSLSLQLACIVELYHQEYDLPSGSMQEPLENIYHHETSVATQTRAVLETLKNADASLTFDQIQWHFFLKSLPSISEENHKPSSYTVRVPDIKENNQPPRKHTFVSSVWSPNVTLGSSLRLKISEHPWDTSNPTLIQSTKDPRWVLTNLQAPPFFYSKTKREKTTETNREKTTDRSKVTPSDK